VVRLSWPIQFPEHRRITGILEGRVKIGLYEVEEGSQMRIPSVLGLLFPSFSYFVQERENLFRTYFIQVAIRANVVTEFGQRGSV